MQDHNRRARPHQNYEQVQQEEFPYMLPHQTQVCWLKRSVGVVEVHEAKVPYIVAGAEGYAGAAKVAVVPPESGYCCRSGCQCAPTLPPFIFWLPFLQKSHYSVLMIFRLKSYILQFTLQAH